MVYFGTSTSAETKATFSPVHKRTLDMPENHEPRWLPLDFRPSEGSVICGKGKESYHHSGNQRFRQLCEQSLDQYANAKSKLEKTLILGSIVDAVQAVAPVGGFVKQDPSTKCWFEVGDDVAREKIGQQMRESLVRRDPSKRKVRKEKRKPKALRSRSLMLGPRKKDSACFLESAISATRPSELKLQNQDFLEPPTFAKAQSDSVILPRMKQFHSGLSTISPLYDDAEVDWCSLEAAASIFLEPLTSETRIQALERPNQNSETFPEPPTFAKAQSDSVILPPQKPFHSGLSTTFQKHDDVEIDRCSLEAAGSIFLEPSTSETRISELEWPNQASKIFLERPALGKAQSNTVQLLPPRQELDFGLTSILPSCEDTALDWSRVEAPSLIFDKGFHPLAPPLADRVCKVSFSVQ